MRKEEKIMNYADIKIADVANGKGVRVSLFVSGCNHHCKGCFNPQAWDFNYGKEFTEEDEERVMEDLDHSYVAGLSLLGGEPLEHQNQKGLFQDQSAGTASISGCVRAVGTYRGTSIFLQGSGRKN